MMPRKSRVALLGIVTCLLLFGGLAPFAASAQTLEDANKLATRAVELHQQGKEAEAEPLYKRALAIREKALGPNHPDLASLLNNLALIYQAGQRYGEAESLYKRALAIREKALGANHPDVARSLVNLADLHAVQARHREAEALYRRALAIRERSLSRDHPELVKLLISLADVYVAQARFAEAEPLHKRALVILERVHGPQHPEILDSLNGLAALYEGQARYAEAEPLYRRALAISEKALGSEDPDLVAPLNNLAAVLRAQARYAEAELLYKRALAISEKTLGPDHASIAALSSNLANVYFEQARYAEAESLYRRALAINERHIGPEHTRLASFLNNLAAVYKEQARYADAEALHRRALAIRERGLGPNHTDVAVSLSNLALIVMDQGRHVEAEPLHRRALAIRETALGPQHPDVAESLSHLARLYVAQARFADAEPLHKRALAIRETALGPQHPDVAESLANLAALYKTLARYAEAEPLDQRALAIRETSLGPEHPKTAASLNNLASVYVEQDRYAEAEPLLRRALAISERAFGHEHPNVAAHLNNLAVAYVAMDRHADAELLLRRALVIRETAQGAQHPDTAETELNLALVYGTTGRHAEALALMRSGTGKGVVKRTVSLRVLGAAAGSVLTKADAAAEAFEVVQMARTNEAASAINQLGIRFAAGSGELAQLIRRDQDLASEAERLDRSLIAAVSREPAQRNAGDEQRLRERLGAIGAQRREIQSTLAARFPQFAALSRPAPLSIKETQSLLLDDEALILIDVDDHSYLWVVTRTDADWLPLRVTATALEAQVKALRESLTFEVDRAFDAGLSHAIYKATLGVVAESLSTRRRLTVVTNGALSALPLQLLITTDSAGKSPGQIDWLVRSHAVTNLPSIASLRTLRGTAAASSGRQPMIAFADPVFSMTARQESPQRRAQPSIRSFTRGAKLDLRVLSESLPPLPGTRREVEAIGKVLGARVGDLRLGPDASETAVKSTRLDQYRVVYFATHGLVAGDLQQFVKSQIEPALALSFPARPDERDDGLLTASEIAELKLDADWVILSACNTAAEGRPGAEALSGLARAFFYAGARSLVVSHWDVSDRAAVDLMTGIFQAMESRPKLTHGEALRWAILAMFERAQSASDWHPRRWAPFVVVGEPKRPD